VKEELQFMEHGDNIEQLQFYKNWFETVPTVAEIYDDEVTEFSVSVSADMATVSFCAFSPSEALVQPVVDLFWHYGFTEEEMEHFNDLGAALEASRLGTWVSISADNGMEGGWSFPGPMPLQDSFIILPDGKAKKKLQSWCLSKNSIETCMEVRSVVGGSYDHSTSIIEIKLLLSEKSHKEDIKVAKEAVKYFGFGSVANRKYWDIIKTPPKNVHSVFYLSFTIFGDHFVQIGVWYGAPSVYTAIQCCDVVGANKYSLASFEGAIDATGASYVELKYTKQCRNIVAKEGPQFIFHYNLGQETGLLIESSVY